MKPRPETLILVASGLLASFLTCYHLTKRPPSTPTPGPVSVSTAPTSSPEFESPSTPSIQNLRIDLLYSNAYSAAATSTANVTLPIIVSETLRVDNGVWYEHPDATMRQMSPPTMRAGYYDLIDTSPQPDFDIKPPK